MVCDSNHIKNHFVTKLKKFDKVEYSFTVYGFVGAEGWNFSSKMEKIVREHKECFGIFFTFIPKFWNRQAITSHRCTHCTVRWTVNVINWYRYCNVQLWRGASAPFIIGSYFFVYFSLHWQYCGICIVQYNGIKWTHAQCTVHSDCCIFRISIRWEQNIQALNGGC